MRTRHALIAAAAIAAALSTPAMAHRQWLLPSTTTLAGTSEYVTVDAAVSNDLFYADHVAIDPTQVKVWAPDGSEGKIENPARGQYRGTFDVKIDKPGTWVIGMERSGVGGTFKVGAETWRVGAMRGRPGGAPGSGGPGAQRPAGAPPAGGPGGPGGPGFPGGAPMKSVATVAEIPANATDIRITENLSKNVIFVTADAPTKTAFAPTGKGLEFDPITHPSGLVQDEEAQFRFLVDGKPAPGVKVSVVPGGKKYRAAEDAQELTTGADGVLKVKWPVAGMYWLNANLTDNKPSEARATERRMSFTTTLEVVAP